MLKILKLFSYNMKNDSSNFSEKLFTPIIELIKIKKYDEALNKLEEFSNQDSDIINRFRGSIYLNKKIGENHYCIMKNYLMSQKIIKY